MKKILIIDTKAGNLFSLKAAIERLGFAVTILDKPNDETFDGVVIPGQGRFGTVLKNIRENKWDVFLESARQINLPILGICVGMQVFFEASEEDSNVAGLSWFKGKAKALDFPKKPMVGWAKLDSEMWSDSVVYFVNSYAIKQSDLSIAETCYGETFCAAIKKDNFIGVQFHPEKSSEAGSEIIRQALSLSGAAK
ncbi:imidazole glycerol phosphate synthase subunit HisH [Aliikangiella coralliicola]|uniref:Imidazole glycerol phosphate synthase subunit HisH n=1 Tax=Aliikangiella coralliicola TaxID=2592383 RepID=A0A545UH09_9GAMM|nr:imidazole glycerol phosphate synthase subunit HisH [Aliikangiella coralliicola]TQV88749.1 imidazole glycerol phosphate synthase subunit HisH [Aliikangiella coralliicola]